VTAALRQIFVVVTPLSLAVVLWFHPPGGENIYEDVRDDVEAWLFVHTAFLFFIPLMAAVTSLILSGLRSTAATVSRIALVFFLVFYTAYEVTIGLGSGILVDYANGLSPADQAVLADAIQDYNRSALLGDPVSVALLLGFLGWVVALVAAAVALRQGGAGWTVTILVALAALFAVHPPPVGPAALVCFAIAAYLVERRHARDAGARRALSVDGPSAESGVVTT
jgi:hypothetical protein